MKILIDHLSRLGDGNLSAAGINDSGGRVRPVPKSGRLSPKLLRKDGGVFAVGAIVELGPTTRIGVAPALEDRLFDPTAACWQAAVDNDSLWQAIDEAAELTLVDIFGHDLTRSGKTAVVPIGAGRASLGTLKPGYRPRIALMDDELRCIVVEPDLGELNLALGDVRLHRNETSRWAVDKSALARLQQAVKVGDPVLLSVGLERPSPGADSPLKVRVNNIHLDVAARRPESSPWPMLDEVGKNHPYGHELWSPDEDRLLTSLYRQGQPMSRIEHILGRPLAGIRNRAEQLRLDA